ncbi:hypothetical protein P6F26_05040 [Roseibacterium sp. SDUM158017]|uniref:hypothetical protein n=1 Tax=Roseicyclus salinarum TaxID=3036773 RepID=UPI0024159344|nr:hypothetical protein [Roseibacterium sp. SDUM158017]MDG4647799.1 hypothetical protein [Roseibacterium sp. SDUM158017]
MSSPKTNIETQAKWHRGPIMGITVGLVLVALIAIAAILWGGFPLEEQAAPDGAPTETIEPGTGAAQDGATGTDTTTQ